jgi:ribosomal protein L14E/L6E/L27E
VKIGQIVFSKAGRDSGKPFIVSHKTEDSIYVVDGKERPIERPKRKNPKHISATKHCLSEESFATNRATRKSIRQALEIDEFKEG